MTDKNDKITESNSDFDLFDDLFDFDSSDSEQENPNPDCESSDSDSDSDTDSDYYGGSVSNRFYGKKNIVYDVRRLFSLNYTKNEDGEFKKQVKTYFEKNNYSYMNCCSKSTVLLMHVINNLREDINKDKLVLNTDGLNILLENLRPYREPYHLSNNFQIIKISKHEKTKLVKKLLKNAKIYSKNKTFSENLKFIIKTKWMKYLISNPLFSPNQILEGNKLVLHEFIKLDPLPLNGFKKLLQKNPLVNIMQEQKMSYKTEHGLKYINRKFNALFYCFYEPEGTGHHGLVLNRNKKDTNTKIKSLIRAGADPFLNFWVKDWLKDANKPLPWYPQMRKKVNDRRAIILYYHRKPKMWKELKDKRASERFQEVNKYVDYEYSSNPWFS